MTMVAERVQRDPVVASEHDTSLIRDLEQYLHHHAQRPARLVDADGNGIEIPAPIYQVLNQIVPLMAAGAAIQLVPIHQELTTQQAADLLNVSRPFLIKLLNEGQIPYHRLGGDRTHRRVRFTDVMAYKAQRSEKRRAAFAEMVAIGDEFGEYD
jgi:excisionase family DNA binding protein